MESEKTNGGYGCVARSPTLWLFDRHAHQRTSTRRGHSFVAPARDPRASKKERRSRRSVGTRRPPGREARSPHIRARPLTLWSSNEPYVHILQ